MKRRLGELIGERRVGDIGSGQDEAVCGNRFRRGAEAITVAASPYQWAMKASVISLAPSCRRRWRNCMSALVRAISDMTVAAGVTIVTSWPCSAR